MRDTIYLVSTEETGFFYRTSKNKRTSTEKLKFKKYDPIVRKHVMFVESTKVSKAKKKTAGKPAAEKAAAPAASEN